MEDNKLIRYRTEMSNDSERNAIQVMLFEITELHNTDILDYVMNHYEMPNILKKNIQDYIDDIDEIKEGDDVVEYMLNEILGCIEDDTGKTIRFAYWLADEDAVRELYQGDELSIYGYDIKNAVVLSDLGYDGALYGFEEEQEPCEEIEPDEDDDDFDDIDEDDVNEIDFSDDEREIIRESFNRMMRKKFDSPNKVTRKMITEARKKK